MEAGKAIQSVIDLVLDIPAHHSPVCMAPYIAHIVHNHISNVPWLFLVTRGMRERGGKQGGAKAFAEHTQKWALLQCGIPEQKFSKAS
jgi:hypothetical protein